MMSNIPSAVQRSNVYGVAGMGAVQNSPSVATPTANAAGGTPQMDNVTQSPVGTFLGIVALLVLIRVAWEVAK